MCEEHPCHLDPAESRSPSKSVIEVTNSRSHCETMNKAKGIDHAKWKNRIHQKCDVVETNRGMYVGVSGRNGRMVKHFWASGESVICQMTYHWRGVPVSILGGAKRKRWADNNDCQVVCEVVAKRVAQTSTVCAAVLTVFYATLRQMQCADGAAWSDRIISRSSWAGTLTWSSALLALSIAMSISRSPSPLELYAPSTSRKDGGGVYTVISRYRGKSTGC